MDSLLPLPRRVRAGAQPKKKTTGLGESSISVDEEDSNGAQRQPQAASHPDPFGGFGSCEYTPRSSGYRSASGDGERPVRRGYSRGESHADERRNIFYAH